MPISEEEEEGANSLMSYESCPAFSSSAGSDQAMVPPLSISQKPRSKCAIGIPTIYSKSPAAHFSASTPSFNFHSQRYIRNDPPLRLRDSHPWVLPLPLQYLSTLSPNEWLGFEYTNDIMYRYNIGYSSPVSGAIGFPWVNAMFNTLTSTQNNISNTTTD